MGKKQNGPQATPPQVRYGGTNPSNIGPFEQGEPTQSTYTPPVDIHNENVEEFRQSFTGVDYRISAVIPYEYDVDVSASKDEVELRAVAARLQSNITAFRIRIEDAKREIARLSKLIDDPDTPPGDIAGYHIQRTALQAQVLEFEQQQAVLISQEKIIVQQLQLEIESRGLGGGGQNPSFYKPFADIQTISISSRRSVSPVRRLGEASPAFYTRGPRTIAGSMVFIFLQENPLVDLFRRVKFDAVDREKYFAEDRLPPFNIHIVGINEYGHQVEGALFGVTLLASGMTLSVDDMYTEQQYTFVARYMLPIAQRKRTVEVEKRLGKVSFSRGLGAASDIETTMSPSGRSKYRNKQPVGTTYDSRRPQ